jgi:hypothetical protein
LTFFLSAYLCSCCAAQSTTQATLLESEKASLCYADCPVLPLPNIYGAYFYCFQADDKLVIGWHQAWEPGLGKLAGLKDKAVSLRIDTDHIWVKLPEGGHVKLAQYYHEYQFTNESCRAAAQMRSFEYGYTRPQPVPGEPAQPVMHGAQIYGWSLCSRLTGSHFIVCVVWDLKGDIRQNGVFEQIREPVTSARPPFWNEATDGAFKVLHLRDGRKLRLLESSPESRLSEADGRSN